MLYTGWNNEYPKLKQYLFLSLYEQCNTTKPNSRLSYVLKSRLENLPKNTRKGIASMSKDGCTPLFIACKRGHVEIVDYLITVCEVDIEQRGTYELPDTRNDRCVTPLWCAAISGKLPVAKCLVKHGADINAVSDTGSTPVGSACFMTNFDVVSFLVENGADIQKGNYCGVTCLINSIKSVQLCFYLLQLGADVNAKDIQDKTALHYAIQEEQFETVKLLWAFGADLNAKNRCGDDALQTACLKGNIEIFEFLIETVSYHPARLADAHELLGSTILDEFNNVETALHYWKTAGEIRNSVTPPLEKLPALPPRAEYRFTKEFTSSEIESLSAGDLDALRIQSLLICERVLGPHHKSLLFRLKYRGAQFVDALMYQKGLDLWKRVLQIRVKHDSVLFSDTSTTAQAVVHLYLDLKSLSSKQGEENAGTKTSEGPNFDDMLDTFQLLAEELPEARELLEDRPIYKKQQENFDRVLKCITHLMFLLAEAAKTIEQKKLLRSYVSKLVERKPRSAIHGDTLLHLSVSRLNTINETYVMNSNLLVFPNLAVVKLLYECGASVNATNNSNSTPLHIAANTYNFNPLVAEFLLEKGAHLDQPNRKGECPKSLLMQNKASLYLLQYDTLKCLAANTVIQYDIPYEGRIPETLRSFVFSHKP